MLIYLVEWDVMSVLFKKILRKRRLLAMNRKQLDMYAQMERSFGWFRAKITLFKV